MKAGFKQASARFGSWCAIVGTLLMGLFPAGAEAIPVLVEAGWTLARTDFFTDAQAARFHPFDGRLYLVRLKPTTLAGGLYRIEEDGSSTLLAPATRPTGVAIDPVDGAIFHGEVQAGILYRTAFGATGRQVWASTFHSGDDDPMGIDIAPLHHVSTLLNPREGVLADEGTGGPREIWRFDAASPGGETVVHAEDGTLLKPVDVTVGATDVYVADLDGSAVLHIENDGSVTPLVTSQPIPGPIAVEVDPRSEELLVIDTGNDEVLRVDPLSGAVSVVMTGLILTASTDQSGLHMTPDGVELIVTDRSAHEVYTYSRLPATSSALDLACGETGLPTFSVLGETALYRFTAGAGDVVAVTAASRNASGAFPHAALFAPDGTRLALGGVFGGCYGLCPSDPLPVDGTYRVVLFEDGHDATGDASISLASLSGAFAGGSNGKPAPVCEGGEGTVFLQCGVPAAGALVVEGDTDPFTILASAGETLRVTTAPTAGSSALPQALLFAPGGAPLSLNGSSAPCSGVCDSATLPGDGTYTVVVLDAFLSGIGGYDVQVDDLVGGQPICQAACSDGIDNDGDGNVDGADSGCLVADDFSEEPACNDGIDNDGDGLIDVADASCVSSNWPSEDPQCDDGIDNDGDGFIDWDGAGVAFSDPQCTFQWQGREKAIRPLCGLGAELGVLLPLIFVARRRRNSRRGHRLGRAA
ncbi:MAG: hypothetical protein JRH01_04935 [Deltaproteobacteria bacterium]|nr:hypothetical protein [Deltaproteobacteria bacterium]MBW2393614.1 hypothetical protein [Deltaproteobacteria bacterium]